MSYNPSKYTGYFREHYGNSFTARDISEYEKWFYSQWNIIQIKCPIQKTDQVLEIGSGCGGFYNLVRGRLSDPSNYFGIELDAEAVNFSNKFFGSENFYNISFEAAQLDHPFDKIFAFEVLEHTDNPESAVKKIYQLLNHNGIFCGTSPYPFRKNIDADQTHRYVLHPNNWKKIFLENGFNEVETMPLSFLPYAWRINKYLNKRLSCYIPFRWRISTILVIATKQ